MIGKSHRWGTLNSLNITEAEAAFSAYQRGLCSVWDNELGPLIAWTTVKPLQNSDGTEGALGITKGWCPCAWGSVSLVLHLLLEGCRSLLDERADGEVLGGQQRPDRKLVYPGQTWKLWDKIVPRNTGFLSFLPRTCRWDCLNCTFVCSFNKANLYWSISYGQALCSNICWRYSRVYLTGEHLSWLSLL